MLGEALALSAALTWAVSVILFKRSEEVPPQGLNLFKNVVALGLLAVTMLLLGHGFALERSGADWLRLALSGLLGIAVADTLFFMALRRLGPGLLAIVECTYAPSMVALAMLFLGERPGGSFALGAVLVVLGIVIVTTERKALVALADPHELWPGVAMAVGAVVTMALGVVLAKPVLEASGLVEVTLVRLAAGIVGQLVWVRAFGTHREALRVFRPVPVWRWLVPAAVLGSFVSMLLWLGGFKWADASVAAVLNQMTAVFIIVLGRVILREPLTPRRITGGVAATAGAIIVVLI